MVDPVDPFRGPIHGSVHETVHPRRRLLFVRVAREESSDDENEPPAAGQRAAADLVVDDAFVLAWAPIPGALDRFLPLSRYRWIALTSRLAAHALAHHLATRRLDASALAGVPVAALAPGTTRALARHVGVQADLAVTGGGRKLAEEMLRKDARSPVLFLRGAGGREELIDVLRGAGVELDLAEVYEVHPSEPEIAAAVARHRAHPYDAVAFASPKAAAAFLDTGVSVNRALIAAIGRTTAAALEGRGLRVDVVASRPSFPVLLDEVAAALACRPEMK